MSTNNIGFRDTSKLSEWISNIIIIRIILVIIIHIMPISPGEEILTMGDWLLVVVAPVIIILNIIGGILFLRWIYFSNINSSLTGAENMNFSPGWSVGWFFIPFMNIFMPFRAMKEIWKTSKNSKSWTSLETPSIIIWWWFLYIVSTFATQAVIRANLGWFDITFSEQDLVIISLSEAAIVTAYLIIQMKLVKEITEMQKEKK